MKKNTCQKCGHQWIPRIQNPKMCPKCKTYKWNEIKIKKEQEE